MMPRLTIIRGQIFQLRWQRMLMCSSTTRTTVSSITKFSDLTEPWSSITQVLRHHRAVKVFQPEQSSEVFSFLSWLTTNGWNFMFKTSLLQDPPPSPASLVPYPKDPPSPRSCERKEKKKKLIKQWPPKPTLATPLLRPNFSPLLDSPEAREDLPSAPSAP